MGVIYATGLGVRRDPAEAWVWMSLAEGTGHSQARKVRLRIEEEMGRGARTQAEREARRFQVLPPRVADDQARTRYAQSGLARLGYNAGPADGVSGPKTRSALADFRRAAGSGGNGPLSDEDVDKIRRHLNQSL